MQLTIRGIVVVVTGWQLLLFLVGILAVVGWVYFGVIVLHDRLTGGPARRAEQVRLMVRIEMERELRMHADMPRVERLHTYRCVPLDWVDEIVESHEFEEVGDYVNGCGETVPHPGFSKVLVPYGDGTRGWTSTVDRFGSGRKAFADIMRLAAEVRRLRAGAPS